MDSSDGSLIRHVMRNLTYDEAVEAADNENGERGFDRYAQCAAFLMALCMKEGEADDESMGLYRCLSGLILKLPCGTLEPPEIQ